MADKKISELTNITGANLADADEFVVVDTSASETKAITWAELKEGLDTGTGFVRITGDTMTGDLSFGDNDKAIFGAGSDLQIYHDGSDSYIKEDGTGNLIVAADDFRVTNVAVTETMISADTDGNVRLYYDNSEKLATTNTGIDVTGTAVTDGLTVAGNVSVDGGTIKLDGNYPVGTGNVALGDAALDDGSLSGAYNTAVGSNALTANTTGDSNTGVGFNSLLSNTTGQENVAVGKNALDANTTANGNTAVGTSSLGNNTTGQSNTALGLYTLLSNTTASNNTAVGYQALYTNSTASSCTAVGSLSQYTSTGASNNSLGRDSLRLNTTGTQNAAFGNDALESNTTGTGNVAMGHRAGAVVTTGSNNTIIGREAGDALTTGGANTFIGRNAGTNSTGNSNTYIGEGSGENATSASDNTFVGQDAGSTVTGSSNTILGCYNGNQGGLDIRTSSNNIVLSDGDGNPRLYINSSGNLLVNTAASQSGLAKAAVEFDSGSQYGLEIKDTGSGTTGTFGIFYRGTTAVGSITTNGSTTSYNITSDYRLKENVVELTGATDRIKQIPVHRFNFIADADTTVDGFLAHEVQAIVPEAVVGTKDAVDADGNPVYQGIDQSKLVPLLVATIKELEARITALEAK